MFDDRPDTLIDIAIWRADPGRDTTPGHVGDDAHIPANLAYYLLVGEGRELGWMASAEGAKVSKGVSETDWRQGTTHGGSRCEEQSAGLKS